MSFSSIKSNRFSLLTYSDFITPKESQSYSESISLLLYALAAISWGINNFHFKYVQHLYKSEYDLFSFILWRMLSVFILGYLAILYNKEKIRNPYYLKCKFWFFLRTVGTCISVILALNSFKLLRTGTVVCLNSMYPAVVIILSVMVLNEKFNIRYVYGLIICLIGAYIIITNEDIDNEIHYHEDDVYENSIDKLLGLSYSFINIVVVACIVIGIKVLNNHNFGYENQLFWTGALSIICCIFQIIWNGRLNYEISFIIHCTMNGIIYFVGSVSTIIAIRGVSLNKTIPLNYTPLVISSVLGVFLLGEAVYNTDLIGTILIVGYNVYNVINPIKE